MSRDWFERRPVLILVVLAAGLWHQLLFSDRFTYLHTPDLTGQVLPWMQVQAEAWHRGEFPVWDPYVRAGQPLLGQMQPGAAFPLNWPLFLAPLDGAGKIRRRMVDLHFGLMHLLAALLAYALARTLGRSRFASVLCGLLYSSAGYVGGVGWPQMLNGAVWLPLVLALSHRAADRASLAFGVLAGGALGLAFLSGHHQTPFYAALAVGALSLARVERSDLRRGLAVPVVLFVVAVLVASLQILPALEYGGDAYRWVGLEEPIGPGDDVPYSVHRDQRLYAVSLLGLVVPPLAFQVDTFVTWIALLGALYAAATRWKERMVRTYGFLGLGALLFSTGPFSPLHGWVYSLVPFADQARSPSHAIYVFQLCVFVLAAFGVDRLLERLETDLPLWKIGVRVLVGFGVLAWLLVLSRTPMGEMEAEPGDAIMLSALFALLLAALLTAWRRGALEAEAFRVLLAALLVSEIYAAGWTKRIDLEDPKHASATVARYEKLRPVMEFLQAQPGLFRFELEADEAGSVSIGAWHGLEQTDGFVASLQRPTQALYDRVGWERAPLLLNTVYTVAKEPTRGGQERVFEDPVNGWNVYRNPEAYPRAWLVATLDSAEPLEQGSATVAEWSPASARIDVESPSSAYLVVAMPAAAGWNAPETHATGLLAFPVAAGASTVELEYRAPGLRLGAALSGVGVLLCLGALVLIRRSRETAIH